MPSWATPNNVACAVCRVTRQLGHRAARFPHGQGHHVLHARCVVEALARGVAPVPLRCPAVSCRAQHPRRDALDAAVQADPGFRNRAARMGGGTAGDADLLSQGLWYGWEQNSLDVRPPLDAVSLGDLQQRCATGKKVQPQLTGAHPRLSVHVLGILNHAMREHRPNRTRRRRTRSCERLSYGISCRPYCIHRTPFWQSHAQRDTRRR